MQKANQNPTVFCVCPQSPTNIGESGMRFRGTLAKDALAVLLDVVLAFSRLSPASSSASASCVFTLSPEALALALKAAGDELQSFARLPLDRLFLDAVVQSQANNHIAFACDVRHLQRALASGKDASAVMLRLLKRDGRSFLCLRTRVRSSPSLRGRRPAMRALIERLVL
jgi:HUS1 checkpoint protein